MKNKFLFLLITFAIVSVTLSPACAFITGKGGTWIEICAGLQTKLIPTNTQSSPPDVTEKQCPFCFQFANMSGIENNYNIIFNYITKKYDGFDSFTAQIRHLNIGKNRDPPFYI